MIAGDAPRSRRLPLLARHSGRVGGPSPLARGHGHPGGRIAQPLSGTGPCTTDAPALPLEAAGRHEPVGRRPLPCPPPGLARDLGAQLPALGRGSGDRQGASEAAPRGGPAPFDAGNFRDPSATSRSARGLRLLSSLRPGRAPVRFGASAARRPGLRPRGLPGRPGRETDPCRTERSGGRDALGRDEPLHPGGPSRRVGCPHVQATLPRSLPASRRAGRAEPSVGAGTWLPSGPASSRPR